MNVALADSPIGEVLVLRAGGSVAEITTIGAHLRRFDVGGRNAVLPFGDTLPWGAHGAVLAPWPNRIAGGEYVWEGARYHLPITEPERGTAIHGLVMDAPWLAAMSENRATLTTEIGPTAGYPFALHLTVAYTLGESSLAVNFTAENRGERTAPFGVGFHPWLAAGPGGLENATLEFQANSWFPTDNRLIPTAETPVPERFDFGTPRAVGTTQIDDAFGHPAFDGSGRSWVHLTGDDAVTVSAWMRSPLQIWQLCSHPGPAPRPALAVEPMSCPADSFNSGDRLTALAAGESFQAQWGITVRAPE